MNVGRDFIRMMSRIMSNHYTLNAHLHRIKLVDSNHCVCGEGYHDIEHVVWSCAEYRIARSLLVDSLRARGRSPNVPVRDVLGRLDVEYMFAIYEFLKIIHVSVKSFSFAFVSAAHVSHLPGNFVHTYIATDWSDLKLR